MPPLGEPAGRFGGPGGEAPGGAQGRSPAHPRAAARTRVAKGRSPCGNGERAGQGQTHPLDNPPHPRYDTPMSKRTRKRKWRLRKNRANHGRRPA
ncbi:hypothetical protein GCM10010357_30610 [Streptomyces luteireticuli]|uniref:Uncharacterized protein n=1 Tax=Streptomyces luteireticuli TaxID=173858 RepID=A0ABP3IK32_9ACTN